MEPQPKHLGSCLLTIVALVVVTLSIAIAFPVIWIVIIPVLWLGFFRPLLLGY